MISQECFYDFKLFTISDDFRNCFVDGAFYFCNDDGLVVRISAFDLAKETFSKVSLPGVALAKAKDTVSVSNLQVVKGGLCVSFFRLKEDLDLYARKKNDVGGFFWTKLFSIRYDELSCKQSPLDFFNLWNGEILGFSKGEDKIYVLCGKYAVYSYDFNEKTIERIRAGDVDNQMAFSCIESLVRVEM
ncbi:hypothetical protein M5689_012307 [Euphorbia peplus]|nr:hypothetical protein M5689_012307 [Euphorbia peplus]